MSWNPETYLAFADYRTRAVHELLARVPLEAPEYIIDLGCGPGNSTAALAARWSRAHIAGLDNSREMLERARLSLPNIAWIEADIAAWQPESPYDLVFANASLQWVPEPETTVRRLFAAVAPGGALAFQVPVNLGALPHTLIDQALEEAALAAAVPPAKLSRHVLTAIEYYRALAPQAVAVDVWDTEYLQVLEGEDAVCRWISGTALVPIFAAIGATDGERFAQCLRALLRAHYRCEADGRTLMPFRRRFVVARR